VFVEQRLLKSRRAAKAPSHDFRADIFPSNQMGNQDRRSIAPLLRSRSKAGRGRGTSSHPRKPTGRRFGRGPLGSGTRRRPHALARETGRSSPETSPPRSRSPRGFAAALIATGFSLSRSLILRTVQRRRYASRAVSASAGTAPRLSGNEQCPFEGRDTCRHHIVVVSAWHKAKNRNERAGSVC
jgi:hypothetical protein